MQSGKILNCKAYVSIFRQPAFRDFLKQEVLPELRLATLIQVKEIHEHRKNATNGKSEFLFEKKKSYKNAPPRHKNCA